MLIYSKLHEKNHVITCTNNNNNNNNNSKNLHRYVESLGIKVHVPTVQKLALLGTAIILRNVLSAWGHWLDKEKNVRQELQYQCLLRKVEKNNYDNDNGNFICVILNVQL